ncbi:MAG TPA: sigma-70 family RNA polymerase sigma factor [Saprospiraceae bacterium]|nr:sigma-70 family RNA polymerase sigma factor [Saprospiraceae bacterium]
MTASSFPPMRDEEICDAIASGGDARNKAIETIYHWQDMKSKVIAYVRQHGGQQADGLDIFHDGIVALDKNIRLGQYRAESNLRGYFYSICRFIWNNEWRRRAKISATEIQDFQEDPDLETPDLILRSEEETHLLKQVLQLLDESCKRILTLWKLSYSMAEIAEEMKLSSPEMAKKYRYRCMNKLMAALDQQPHLMTALKNV